MELLRLLLLSSIIFKCFFLHAQDTISDFKEPAVFNYGKQLINPWTGGFNSCQFSEIDLNDDGKKDLFVFDRSGNRISTYINKGKNKEIAYEYAPEFIKYFPDLNAWALLVDYNVDGKEDIFTSTTGGIKVYKNTSNLGLLSFELVSSMLYSDYGSKLNLYVNSADIPAIADVDFDGDQDVLTFSILGSYLEWHRNLSIEKYGKSDSLVFKVESNCWGNFTENDLNSEITLNVSCTASSGSQGGYRHAGSTLLAFDADSDRDLDLLVGDVSSHRLLLLLNGGDSAKANITAVDGSFPSSKAIDIQMFPAAFYVDVNNDFKKDLLVSPNAPNVSENYKSVHLYLNNSDSVKNTFNFLQSDFLQDNTLDFGEGAYPHLYDVNSDGFVDLLVGNYGFYSDSNLSYLSKISYFKNTGTNKKPQFNLIDDDFAELSKAKYLNLTPTMSDLDADGDADLVVGTQDGQVIYYECMDTVGRGSYKKLPENLINVDVGQAASPFLIDVNADGKKDLIVGERSGTLNYLPNRGTFSKPLFDTLIEKWGAVNVTEAGMVVGNSMPFAYRKGNVLYLIVGSEAGKMQFYEVLTGASVEVFRLLDRDYGRLAMGIRVAPAGFDFDENGIMDYIIGNYAGGLRYFKSDQLQTVFSNLKSTVDFEIRPNPNVGDFDIVLSDVKIDNSELAVYDYTGKLIWKELLTSDKKHFSFNYLPDGIYVIRLANKAGQIAKKFIKKS